VILINKFHLFIMKFITKIVILFENILEIIIKFLNKQSLIRLVIQCYRLCLIKLKLISFRYFNFIVIAIIFLLHQG